MYNDNVDHFHNAPWGIMIIICTLSSSEKSCPCTVVQCCTEREYMYLFFDIRNLPVNKCLSSSRKAHEATCTLLL